MSSYQIYIRFSTFFRFRMPRKLLVWVPSSDNARSNLYFNIIIEMVHMTLNWKEKSKDCTFIMLYPDTVNLYSDQKIRFERLMNDRIDINSVVLLFTEREIIYLFSFNSR